MWSKSEETSKVYSEFKVFEDVICALNPQSGKYYADCREKEPKPQGQDDETAKKLWDITAKAVGL